MAARRGSESTRPAGERVGEEAKRAASLQLVRAAENDIEAEGVRALLCLRQHAGLADACFALENRDRGSPIAYPGERLIERRELRCTPPDARSRDWRCHPPSWYGAGLLSRRDPLAVAWNADLDPSRLAAR